MKKKKNGFTLIELIAVLVIMAIIALIVTPLVMNIIRKARISADKRSIDAYGRSIELAVASYLLDTGKFPTSVEQLTIEYSGSEVVCETTQLNSDSSVYLTGCRVAGRSVDYAYGSDKNPKVYESYSVGDEISYNGVTYYVIEDSASANDTVKLLKENPLTKTEIDNLGLTGIDVKDQTGQGYGQIEYGNTADYSESIVKQVVDAWSHTAIKSGDNIIARLITYSEIGAFKFSDIKSGCGNSCYPPTDLTPSWVYNNNGYWTMSQYNDSSKVWIISSFGIYDNELSSFSMVRPLLEISKTADLIKL